MKKLIIIVAFLGVILMGALYPMCVSAANFVIKADKQTVNGTTNKIDLEGNVKVTMDDITIVSPKAQGNIDPKTQKLQDATFQDKAYAYQIKQGKKHEVKANIIKISLIKKTVDASGNSQSVVTQGITPVLIVNADSQEYDTKNDKMSANGSVIVFYKDVETFSNSAVVNITPKGDLKKLELIGDAKIQQKDSLVKGAKFTYTPDNGVIIVQNSTYTDAKVDDDNIQVWANYQQLDNKSKVMIAGGNVVIFYKDYKTYGPKATVYSDPNTNKYNKIVFSGRSKIVQEGRTIEADTIIITMEPKNFYAQGNVVTTLPNMNSDDSNISF